MDADARRTAVLVMMGAWLMLAPGADCAADSADRATGLSMTVVRDGKASATIIMSPDANDVVQEAVQDLQMYIEKISGAKLPVADSAESATGNLILVGRTPAVEKLIPDLDAHDLGHDGYIIRSLPGKLVLTGKSDGRIHEILGPLGRTDCGTPNAVYSFLESLGCRWYMPGDDGQVVPRKATIDLPPLDVASKPDVAGRWIGDHVGRTMGPAFHAQYARWLARLRTANNRYYASHTMNHLLSKAQYGTSHPEYFALIDGKRQTNWNAQACTSNPDIIDIVSENLQQLITSEGPWRSYGPGQYDGFGWCQCQPCQGLYGDKTFVYRAQKHARHVGLAPSDEPVANIANGYLKFVNAVADRMAKVDPNCLQPYFALYNIPGFPEVKPRDNVMPVMCSLAPNDAYWRREVQRWEAISRQLYYHGYMGHRIDFLKLEIANDIRWCYEHKGVAISLEQDAHSPINAISQYLAAKAMWDTQIDSKKILAEFYRLYYGAAEEPMRLFYQTFYAATRDAVRDYDCFYSYPDALAGEAGTRCRGYIDRALKLADAPVVRRRIESLSRYWRATELQVASQEAMALWRQHKNEANREAARAALQATIDYINSVAGEFHLQVRIGLLTGGLGELDKG